MTQVMCFMTAKIVSARMTPCSVRQNSFVKSISQSGKLAHWSCQSWIASPGCYAAGADDANLDNILEKAASLSHISAVMLVANGSQVRETIGMKNVFTLLRGHLPDAVLTNTLAVLTNCTKLSRQVALLPKFLLT